jgi:hypothetical protein
MMTTLLEKPDSQATTADEPRFFMSYSRHELYFAEAIVLALQKAGLNIWFDLQQLEPGCNWQQEIARGLETCSGVIVLASRASLASPWVAHEWEHAVAHDKPLHLVLFEAVDFQPFTLTDPEGEPREVRLDPLRDRAVSIIDARSHFMGNVARLAESLKGQTRYRDPIPPPNRWNIPLRMPLAIAAVLAGMGLLTILAAYITLFAFSVNLAMMAAGAIITAWLATRTWAFIQRTSYRDTRVALVIGALLSPVIAVWSVPIFVVAAVITIRSPDIHRWSPLGQGLERNIRAPHFHSRRKQAEGFWERLSVWYARQFGVVKAFVDVSAVLGGLVGLGSLSNSPGAAFYCVAPCIGLLLLSISLRRKHRRLVESGLGRAAATGLTYIVISDSADFNIATQVETAMTNAGHRRWDGPGRRADSSAPRPDYTIIILTNNIDERKLQPYFESQDRLIFIVGSALDDWERFRRFSHYQWVDYRRQQPGRLDAMAEDILIFGSDIVTHSFGTRQTPQSFDKLLIPGRVAAYLGLQYFFLNLNMFFFARALVTGGSNAFELSALIMAIPTLFYSVWLTNRIIRREITVSTLLTHNIVVSVVSYGVGFVIGLSQPLPPGYVRDFSRLPIMCISQGVGLLIGYYIGRGFLNAILGGWLPNFVPFMPSFPGLRRDWSLWRRNLVATSVTTLFTLVFTGRPVAAENTLKPLPGFRTVDVGEMLFVNIPDHWLETAETIVMRELSAPLAAALERIGTPLSQGMADALNEVLIGNQGRVSAFEPDTTVANKLTSDLNANGYRLRRDFRALYTTDVGTGRGLAFSIWQMIDGFREATIPGQVITGLDTTLPSFNATTQRSQLDSETTVYDHIFTAAETENRLVIYDTRSVDFIMLVSADPETMQSERQSVTEAFATVRLNVPPAPTPTPTLPPTRTPPPTATFVPVFATFAGFGFRAPDGWLTASISNLNALTIPWQGSGTADSQAHILLQNFEQLMEKKVKVRWAATTGRGNGILVMAVADYIARSPANASALLDDFIARLPVISPDTTVETDDLPIDRATLQVRRLNVLTQTPGYLAAREWFIAVDAEDQAYVLWIVGLSSTMTQYQPVLEAWLDSFAAN